MSSNLILDTNLCLAMEWGYKACERGLNISKAMADFRDVVLGESPNVTCLDCSWKGKAYELLAQACPVCDGRVADV